MCKVGGSPERACVCVSPCLPLEPAPSARLPAPAPPSSHILSTDCPLNRRPFSQPPAPHAQAQVGGFRDTPIDDLVVAVLKETLRRTGVAPEVGRAGARAG